MEDLEECEEYLKELWPSAAGRHPDVPSYVKTYLRVESGDACALCGRGWGLDYSYIWQSPKTGESWAIPSRDAHICRPIVMLSALTAFTSPCYRRAM